MFVNYTVVFLLSFCLSMLFCDCTPKKAKSFINSTQVAVKKLIKFRAKLITAPSGYQKCGDDKVAVGFRFRVIDSEKLLNQEVVVIFPCPEQYGQDQFFSEGHIFLIKAEQDLSEKKNYSVTNNFAADKLETLWGIEISKQSR